MNRSYEIKSKGEFGEDELVVSSEETVGSYRRLAKDFRKGFKTIGHLKGVLGEFFTDRVLETF